MKSASWRTRFAIGSLLALPLAAFGASVVQTGQVRAELLAHAPEGITPGKPFWLGLQFTHAPHWHTYWKNPGDSGLPTTFNWTLPEGVSAGDIDWPTPKRLPIGPLLNYGYDDTVLLPVRVTVVRTPPGTSLRVKLEADWLVCKVECIPQSGRFEIDLPIGPAVRTHEAVFTRTFQSTPFGYHTAEAAAHVSDGMIELVVPGLRPAVRGDEAQVFPEVAGVVDNPAPVEQGWDGMTWRARWRVADQRSESPAMMPFVLAFDRGAARVELPVTGWPVATASIASSPGAGNLPGATVPAVADALRPPQARLGFFAALAFALLGGVILNLMPCVFPVLSLKVLALSQHAGDARDRWKSALAYTAGVVLSFLVLAGLLIAARAGGEQLGWGFQLQSPGTIVALAALFTLIGLNLAGVFEVGSLLPSSIASLRARDPTLDSFLTGVLAAAVASPCTAPFMGAALGAALAWPTAQSLAVFAALGLGVAAPYLVASAIPGVARWLPRPGRWMQTFRIALAFPMFATVIWLTWVLGHQTGVDGAAALLVALLALTLAAWWWSQRPAAALPRALNTLALLALTIGAFVWAAPLWSDEERSRAPELRAAATVGGLWQPWSPTKVAELRAAGRKVFVDFTAAWCVTCQYNKRTTLAHAEVLAAFEANKVASLRADWTSRDAVIAAELARLGRSGVPAYVFYDGAQAPRLLSELPSVDEIRAAVAGDSIQPEQ